MPLLYRVLNGGNWSFYCIDYLVCTSSKYAHMSKNRMEQRLSHTYYATKVISRKWKSFSVKFFPNDMSNTFRKRILAKLGKQQLNCEKG